MTETSTFLISAQTSHHRRPSWSQSRFSHHPRNRRQSCSLQTRTGLDLWTDRSRTFCSVAPSSGSSGFPCRSSQRPGPQSSTCSVSERRTRSKTCSQEQIQDPTVFLVRTRESRLFWEDCIKDIHNSGRIFRFIFSLNISWRHGGRRRRASRNKNN